MILPKIDLPKNFGRKSNVITSQVESMPFFVKECGYCSDKKFKIGDNYNYSDYLLLYSISGVMRFTKDTSTQYIQKDHIIVSSCNTPLTFTRTSKEWMYFYIIVNGSHTKLFYNIIRNKSCAFLVPRLSGILNLFIDIYNLSYTDISDNMKAGLSIHSIFYELYKISSQVLEAKNITPIQETIVNTTLKYIARNYKNDLNIDTICSEVNFSKYYFCKIFKNHTGVTLHQYVNTYRVEKSKDLLTYSKLSINAIATSVGFKNALTYSRCFEQSVHMTPSEYRKYF